MCINLTKWNSTGSCGVELNHVVFLFVECVLPYQLRQKLTVQSEWQMGSGSEWVNFNTVDGQVGNLEVGRMKTGCVCNSECVFVLLLYLYNYMVIGVWGVSVWP